MTFTFSDSQSFKNGYWLPQQELAWGVTDLGTTQGAMLVERLRTFGGRLIDVDDHLVRLAEGAEKLGIPWPPRDIAMKELCYQLVQRNQALLGQETDFGLVLLVSPGDSGIDRRLTLTPTVIGHVTPLPFAQLSRWYQHGTSLHISSVRNVPAECWSPSIKTRSRLQYYLADQTASGSLASPATTAKKNGSPSSRNTDSIAVLLNIHGFVTETSISNLLILGQDGVLRSPFLKDILWGMSLKTVCQLAESIDQPFEFADIPPHAMVEAKEILMTGTTGGLWSAISVDGYPIGDGFPGRLCRRLQAAWQEKIGVHFIESAIRRVE